MAFFIVDDAKRSEIAKAVETARSKVIPWDVLRKHAIDDPGPTLNLADRKPGAEELADRSVPVRFVGGVTAAISFEEQPAGICRHLSVALAKRPGKLVDPTLFLVIAKLFGFDTTGQVRTWVEEFAPGEFAINIVTIEIPREEGHA